jgi:tRNA-uridine 2-sulfurtransferase
VVGEHIGLAFYTIGQRKGIGIGGMANMKGEAWYVADKRRESNELIVVQGHDHPLLMKRELKATDPAWIGGVAPEERTLSAKTRYRQADAACTVERVLESEIRVGFEAPQWAVTPGQSVVLYEGEVCLGGGIIT